jgi:hypothetical protein
LGHELASAKSGETVVLDPSLPAPRALRGRRPRLSDEAITRDASVRVQVCSALTPPCACPRRAERDRQACSCRCSAVNASGLRSCRRKILTGRRIPDLYIEGRRRLRAAGRAAPSAPPPPLRRQHFRCSSDRERWRTECRGGRLGVGERVATERTGIAEVGGGGVSSAAPALAGNIFEMTPVWIAINSRDPI